MAEKTLAEIARAAWMKAGDLEDHWEIAAAAVRNAVIEECAKAACRECRSGCEPRYNASVNYYYHDLPGGGGELVGCSASVIHALKGKTNG